MVALCLTQLLVPEHASRHTLASQGWPNIWTAQGRIVVLASSHPSATNETIQLHIFIMCIQVLINHGYTFQDDATTRQQLRISLQHARAICTSRASDLIPAALADPDAILTAAVRRVIKRAPLQLRWQQLQSSCYVGGLGRPLLGSFEAVAEDESGVQHLYSINMMVRQAGMHAATAGNSGFVCRWRLPRSV